MLYFNDDKLHDRIVRVRFSSLLFGISFSFFFFQRGRFDFYDCSIILILSYLLRRPGSVDFSTRTTTSINVFYGVVSFGRPSPAWRRGVVKPLSFFCFHDRSQQLSYITYTSGTRSRRASTRGTNRVRNRREFSNVNTVNAII